jgi:hypothetical protein
LFCFSLFWQSRPLPIQPLRKSGTLIRSCELTLLREIWKIHAFPAHHAQRFTNLLELSNPTNKRQNIRWVTPRHNLEPMLFRKLKNIQE